MCYKNWIHEDEDEVDRIKDELKENFTEEDVLRWLELVAHRAYAPEHCYFAAYVCMLRDLQLDLKYKFEDYKVALFSCACEHFDRVAAPEEVSARATEFLVTQLGRGGTDFW